MSLCFSSFFIDQNDGLDPNSYSQNRQCKEAHPHTRSSWRAKGSYTIEAAFVIPMVTVFLVMLVYYFRVMQVEAAVQESLLRASRIGAAECGAVTGDTARTMLAKGICRKELLTHACISEYVRGGQAGIRMSGSGVTGDYLTLHAEYTVRYPIRLLGKQGVTLVSVGRSRMWTGRDYREAQEDPLVYYTPDGTVYHLTASCSYLDLSIRSTTASKLSGLRNQSGSKYNACKLCAAENTNAEILYITDYGDSYHSSLTCSGLKRTILRAHVSGLPDRGLCSKCKRTAS